MTDKANENLKLLYELIRIHKEVQSEKHPKYIYPNSIEYCLEENILNGINRFQKGGELNSTIIKSYIDDLLSNYRHQIGVPTEVFWNKLKYLNISIERKDPLRTILKRERFSDNFQQMEIRNNWKYLLKSNLLTPRFNMQELLKIEEIIMNHELKKVALLKRCLLNPKLVQSNYLNYGAALGYLTNGLLFDFTENSNILLERYFDKTEIKRLEEIWQP